MHIVAEASENSPAAHVPEIVDSPVIEQKLPGGHAVGLEMPGISHMKPAGQLIHALFADAV